MHESSIQLLLGGKRLLLQKNPQAAKSALQELRVVQAALEGPEPVKVVTFTVLLVAAKTDTEAAGMDTTSANHEMCSGCAIA